MPASESGDQSLGQTCAVASEGRTNHQVHRGGDDTKNEHLDEVATGEEQCRYGAAGVDDTSERKDRVADRSKNNCEDKLDRNEQDGENPELVRASNDRPVKADVKLTAVLELRLHPVTHSVGDRRKGLHEELGDHREEDHCGSGLDTEGQRAAWSSP